MKDLKRLAHAVWECKYHIVWCLKYRFISLKAEIRKSERDITKLLCEWKEVEILGFLKWKSAIKIFDMHSELKKRYRGRHFWATEYFMITIGLYEEQIHKYLRWQLKKDKTMDRLKL